jgi:hypothetical protein
MAELTAVLREAVEQREAHALDERADVSSRDAGADARVGADMRESIVPATGLPLHDRLAASALVRPSLSSHVRLICQFIRGHYAEQLSLRELAGHVGRNTCDTLGDTRVEKPTSAQGRQPSRAIYRRAVRRDGVLPPGLMPRGTLPRGSISWVPLVAEPQIPRDGLIFADSSNRSASEVLIRSKRGPSRIALSVPASICL